MNDVERNELNRRLLFVLDNMVVKQAELNGLNQAFREIQAALAQQQPQAVPQQPQPQAEPQPQPQPTGFDVAE